MKKEKMLIEVRPVGFDNQERKIQVTLDYTNLFLTEKEATKLKKQLKKVLKQLKNEREWA